MTPRTPATSDTPDTPDTSDTTPAAALILGRPAGEADHAERGQSGDPDVRTRAQELLSRGPLTLTFPAGLVGDLIYADLLDGDGTGDAERAPARGTVVAQGGVEVLSVQLFNPTAAQLRALPVEHLGTIDVVGLDREAFIALAGLPGAGRTVVQAILTQDDIDDQLAADPPTPETRRGLRPGGETIGDEAFAALAEAGPLHWLAVSGGDITDDTLIRVVASHPELTACSVEGQRFTGAGLSRLPRLPQADYASFSSPQVFEGLDAEAFVAALPALTELDIRRGSDDEPTDEDLAALRAAAPEVEINEGRDDVCFL